jgi:thiol-disulfide isomerase/thioredoxin
MSVAVSGVGDERWWMMGDRGLDRLANICLIVACVFVCGFLSLRLLESRTPTAAAKEGQYKVGEKLPALAGVRYEDTPKTVLLVLSTDCPFCREGMSFYAQLARQRTSGRLQLVVLSTESESVVNDFLIRYGVDGARVASIRPGEFRIAATPTLIVADRQGRCLALWKGALRGRERDVLEAL